MSRTAFFQDNRTCPAKTLQSLIIDITPKSKLDALLFDSKINTINFQRIQLCNVNDASPTLFRRNCKGNPFCLNGLGERSWMDEIDESQWNDIEDPDKEKRQEVIKSILIISAVYIYYLF